ncbi:hypothetical protein MHYP_G00059970 [Metynnis hypsauchen]
MYECACPSRELWLQWHADEALEEAAGQAFCTEETLSLFGLSLLLRDSALREAEAWQEIRTHTATLALPNRLDPNTTQQSWVGQPLTPNARIEWQ